MIEREVEKLHKFLLKFASKDPNRYFISGVHYEDGLAVATDGKVLAVERAECPEEWEGKTIGRDLAEVEGQFPNWKKVVPEEGIPVGGFDLALEKWPVLKVCEKLSGEDAVFKFDDGSVFSSEMVGQMREWVGRHKWGWFATNADLNPKKAHLWKYGDAFLACMPMNRELDAPTGWVFAMPEEEEMSLKDAILKLGKRDVVNRIGMKTLTEGDENYIAGVREAMQTLGIKEAA